MLCETVTPSRRAVLGASGSLFAWAFMPRCAQAARGRDARFVTIILRGALDGLTAVPPLGDPDYEALRQSIALHAEGANAAFPLDGFFALHPSMPNFARLFRAGQACVVHASATAYRDRSHFDGQDVLEFGLRDPGQGRFRLAQPHARRLAEGREGRPGASEKAIGLAVGANAPLVIRGRAPVLGWAPADVAASR